MKDAIITNAFTDLVLLRLVDLTITSNQSGQPLFPNLLAEPVFFRKYFRLWVREALEEKKQLDEQNNDPFAER